MRLAKIAMYNAHNIKTISQKTHLSQEIISAEIAIKSLLYVCLPNTLVI